MNRAVIIIATIVFIIIGVIAVITNLTNPNNQPGSARSSSNEETFVRVDACDILTKKVVEETFGGTVSGTTPVKGGSSNTDMLVTACSLTSRDSNKENGTATLLARIALNEIGAGNNRQQFETSKPQDAINVDEIGDKAYFVPSFNQLHILIGNNWYTLSSYKTNVLDGTLESNKALAQKLRFQ